VRRRKLQSAPSRVKLAVSIGRGRHQKLPSRDQVKYSMMWSRFNAARDAVSGVEMLWYLLLIRVRRRLGKKLQHVVETV